MPNLDPLLLSLRDHWTNIRHHANTQAFIKAFFPALGWAFGLMPLALAVRFQQ